MQCDNKLMKVKLDETIFEYDTLLLNYMNIIKNANEFSKSPECKEENEEIDDENFLEKKPLKLTPPVEYPDKIHIWNLIIDYIKLYYPSLLPLWSKDDLTNKEEVKHPYEIKYLNDKDKKYAESLSDDELISVLSHANYYGIPSLVNLMAMRLAEIISSLPDAKAVGERFHIIDDRTDEEKKKNEEEEQYLTSIKDNVNVEKERNGNDIEDNE